MSRIFLLVLALASLFASGCLGSEESPMTAQEVERLKNPSKTIPPEAIEAMSKMGEGMRRSAEERAKAGVDSRGVPLHLSKENQAANPPAPPTGGQ